MNGANVCYYRSEAAITKLEREAKIYPQNEEFASGSCGRIRFSRVKMPFSFADLDETRNISSSNEYACTVCLIL